MFFGEIEARVQFEARQLDRFGEEVDDFFAFQCPNKARMMANHLVKRLGRFCDSGVNRFGIRGRGRFDDVRDERFEHLPRRLDCLVSDLCIAGLQSLFPYAGGKGSPRKFFALLNGFRPIALMTPSGVAGKLKPNGNLAPVKPSGVSRNSYRTTSWLLAGSMVPCGSPICSR